MTGDVLPQALAILERIWGYNQFRGTQEVIVRTVAEGHHALVLMPTGERILETIKAATDAPQSDASARAEQAAHHQLKSPETAELSYLPTLLEHVAKELRAGRCQLNPICPETILQDALPGGTEFQGWHCQEQDGVLTLVLRLKRHNV